MKTAASLAALLVAVPADGASNRALSRPSAYPETLGAAALSIQDGTRPSLGPSLSASLDLPGPAAFVAVPALVPPESAPPGSGVGGNGHALSRDDHDLLQEIQRRAFLFFWENTNPDNGLTKDRARNFEPADRREVASIAATGFSLMALGLGRERGWISHEQAYERALITLRYLRDVQPHFHGWFYHWLNSRTGEPEFNREVSSIDTALLLTGALFVGQYFRGSKVQQVAEDIYRRVDFNWMMTDGGAKPDSRTLNMGWTEKGGFMPWRWETYSEGMILYLLGLGSPTFPLPPESWHAFSRDQGSYGGTESIAAGPLFIHQYPHLGADLRDRRDAYTDYFKNSVNATLSNRQFCIDQADRYSTYGENSWGLTSCDAPDGGYRPYGAPPGQVLHDGTVAPTAAGGSIAFTPELSIRALRFMRERFGDRLWGRYGFSDAYNTDVNNAGRFFNAGDMWRSQDVVGIDQGAILLMIENLRSGLIWKTVMESPHIQAGMRRAGFTEEPPR